MTWLLISLSALNVAMLEWEHPVARTDGSKLEMKDIRGYYLYKGDMRIRRYGRTHWAFVPKGGCYSLQTIDTGKRVSVRSKEVCK